MDKLQQVDECRQVVRAAMLMLHKLRPNRLCVFEPILEELQSIEDDLTTQQ